MKLSLAQNISRLRKQNGLTQERLAEALGVSFAAVSIFIFCNPPNAVRSKKALTHRRAIPAMSMNCQYI